MLRRLLVVSLVVPLALAGAAHARARTAAPLTSTTFVITGHGWGHGVGMAQYGALGYALHGVSYDRILKHYYPGVTIGPAPVRTVRVLLAEGASALTVASDASFRVRDGAGKTHPLAPGSYRFGPRLRLRAPTGVANSVVPLPGPLTFVPGSAPLRLDRPYRGAIEVAVSDGRLDAINVVDIDSYIRGVVSEEMPHDWPLEAVKAQAVAARSYAISQRRTGQLFDVYSDTRDQVYGGIEAETPVGDAAVAATRQQVLLYNGRVIVAYFSSSSGGETAPITSLYPDSKPVPYLVAVPDPWDVLSPYHLWGPVVYTGAQLAQRLGVTGVTDLRPVPATGHATVVDLDEADGETTMSALDVRRALDLRSTWFRAAVLSLTAPPGRAAPGTAVTLTGFAKRLGLARPVLEQRQPGVSDWQAGPALRVAADGSFSVAVAPTVTTDYRLRAATVTGQPVRVSVSAQ
jgi:stage II sporulation protein D